jgi:hypothetical protein
MAYGAYAFFSWVNYETIVAGKMPFKYEELKALINNKNVITSIALIGCTMVVVSQFGDIMRYLYKNQDSFCKVIYTAFTYLIMLVLGYGIALA